jgi:hypothetical protein
MTLFIPQRRIVPSISDIMGGSSRLDAAAPTPRKTPRIERIGREEQVDADMTLDVKDLMAKMSKPKRASGTEESFVDLLRNAPELEGIDECVYRYLT